jgi:hypothetical protein
VCERAHTRGAGLDPLYYYYCTYTNCKHTAP